MNERSPGPDPIDRAELEGRLRAALAASSLPAAPGTLRASLERLPSTATRPVLMPRLSPVRGLPIAATAIVVVALVGAGLAGRFSGPAASVPPTASFGPTTSGLAATGAPTGPLGSQLALIPWIDATPPPAPGKPTPRPVPPGTRSCAAADLTATASWEGATGSMAGGIGVTNVSSTACVIDGPPKLVVILAGTTTMQTAYVAVDAAGPAGTTPPGPGLLEPGDRGDWWLFWTNWCGNPLVPTDVLVTLPDGSGPLHAVPDTTISGAAVGLSRPRCDAPESPSSLTAMAFEYRAPEPAIVEPQPAAATITAPATATIGQDVTFTVTLTNRGDKPAIFDPCPTYSEDLLVGGVRLKPPADREYALNCAALGGPMAPGATVTFEMRYPIPDSIAPGPAELLWSMDPGGPFDTGAFGRVPVEIVAGGDVPALTVDGPTVSVSPSTGLVDGQVVTVHVTGFGVGGKVFLSECSSAQAATSLGCGAELAAQTLLVTDDSRQGSATFTVTAHASAGPVPADGVQTCSTDCVIVATLGGGYPFVVAPISFGTALSPVQGACPIHPAVVDPPGLDCAAAVSAALSRLVTFHPAIVSIEVGRGAACPPNTRCYAPPPGDIHGFVVVHFASGDAVMVPVVGIGPGRVTAGTPSSWPVPACPDPSSLTPAPTLTCAAAVTAATPRLPAGHSEIVSTIFNFGTWCPAGAGCTPTLGDRGYVVFSFADREPLMVRVVEHASTGNIVASPAEPYPPTP